MAGLLEFVGDVPEYIRKAAQNKLAEKAASDARKVSVMANEGGMRPSVTKAANNALKEYAKGSLKYEGGMRESVRKAAEKVLQGGAAEVAPAAAKTGLLGLTSSVAGPLTTVASAAEMLQGDKPYQTNPRMANQLGMDQELYQGNMAKGFPQDPTGMSKRAVDAGMSAVKAGSDQYKTEAAQGKHPIFQAAVQEKATQVESQRQVVEAGAKEKLRTNQLSRPKAAEEVVKADIQRSGEKVTPEEFKTRVKKEVTSMKTMDDDQLSKYLSYALIAGGLIASHLDESGNAGKAFAGGFNAQVDRNQQMAMFKEKQKAEAEAAAAEAARWEKEFGVKKSEAESKASDRVARQGLSREQLELDRERNSVLQDQGERRLGLMAERNANETGSKDNPYGKGVPLNTKDATKLISEASDALGVNLGTGVKEAAAAKFRSIQKLRPDLSIDEQLGEVFKDFSVGNTDPLFGSPEKQFQLKQ